MKLSQEQINKANKIHNNSYTYLEGEEYTTKLNKITITCPVHGDFKQSVYKHLSGLGCPKCNGGIRYSKEGVIEKVQKIYGDLYDLTNINYVNSTSKIEVMCKKHGLFQTTSSHLLQGHKCPKCALEGRVEKRTYNYIQFEDKSTVIHKGKYIYYQDYINSQSKVRITCPIHGDFYQKANNHIQGKGCPLCNSSKLESEIIDLLDKNNIVYDYNKFYDFLNNLQLDFFIPTKNIAIECQGEQHFKIKEHFGGEEEFKKRVELDKKKKQLCEEHGIKLLYFSNLGIDYPYEVYENKEELLKEIVK